MSTTATSSVARVPASPSSGAAGPELAHLVASNPGMSALLQSHPELGKFLARQVARGAVEQPGAGKITTPITWNVWSHSPASLGDASVKWREQFLFFYAVGPNEKASVDFGSKGTEPGKLIGVFRYGDLGIPMKKHGSLEGGSSKDGGFEFQVSLLGLGKAGEKASIWFATGCIDDKGLPVGDWGLGLGYSGRKHEMVHGTPVEPPIHEDNGGYSVLRPDASGKLVAKPVAKPAGIPRGW